MGSTRKRSGPTSYSLKNRAVAAARLAFDRIFSIPTLKIIGSVAGIFAAIVGLIYLEDERQDRLLAREMAAWTLLRDASHSSGNLGRARALELLRSQGADLSGVDLGRATLANLDLSNTFLHEANLEGAVVEWSNLAGSFLLSANFKGAELNTVILIGANLSLTNFSNASLFAVKADYADFSWANFEGAEITFDSSNEADFSGADFSGAKFLNLIVDGFKPKSKKFTRGKEVVRLIGGSVDRHFEEKLPCYAWARDDRKPSNLPRGYAVVLVSDVEHFHLEACADDPKNLLIGTSDRPLPPRTETPSPP